MLCAHERYPATPFNDERGDEFYLAPRFEVIRDFNSRKKDNYAARRRPFWCPYCRILYEHIKDAKECHTKNFLDHQLPQYKIGDYVEVVLDSGELIIGEITDIDQWFEEPVVDESLPTDQKIFLKHNQDPRFVHNDVWGEDIPCAELTRLTLNDSIEIANCMSIRKINKDQSRLL